MPTLKRQYRKHIAEGFDWDDLKRQAGEAGSVFIGTVFSLSPSGKFYSPWACGNLDPCPVCRGTGSLPRKVTECARCDGTGRAATWDSVEQKKLYGAEKGCEVCEGSGFRPAACRTCGGMGSLEAYRNEVFWEVFREIADSHGLYLEEGDGDPCDVFLISCSQPGEE